MRMTTEQQQAIANRLGITAPEQPQEVTEYLTAWDTYEEAVSEYEAQRLSTWERTSERIKANAEAIFKMRSDLKNIWQLGEAVEAFSQTTKLASKAWQQAQREYLTAIEAEAERPQREFDRARREFTEALEKEQRSLKYKMSRSRDSWNLPADSPEVIQRNEWSARYDLISYLVQEARYVEATPDTPIFSEEAIALRVLENQYRVSDVLAKLSLVAETLETTGANA